MILLRPDCLVFKAADGASVPCSVTEVTFELLGEDAQQLDAELLQHAAEAVLHYFKKEKGKDIVTVTEFSDALERVFRGLGLQVLKGAAAPASPGWPSDLPPRIIEADLRQLAGESAIAGELIFFPLLREAVRRELNGTPMVFRFHGLRECVKQLTGAKRWSGRCQALNDQIVDYLRTCIGAEQPGTDRALIIL